MPYIVFLRFTHCGLFNRFWAETYTLCNGVDDVYARLLIYKLYQAKSINTLFKVKHQRRSVFTIYYLLCFKEHYLEL